MKELLDHDTYILEDKVIKDEDGNELGRIEVGASLLGGEYILYDSQGKKWGRVKVKLRLTRYVYNFHDHNENIIAKMKPKSFRLHSFWMEDPEGQKIYEISKSLGGTKYDIKDKNRSSVAQVNYIPLKPRILKIKNLKPLIALLTMLTIEIYNEQETQSDFWMDL